MNKKKHVIFLICAVLAALIQTSVIFPLSQTPLLHLPILLSLIAFFYLPVGYAFFYASMSMFFLDMYSTTPFGSSIIVIIILVGLSYVVSRTLLPHKSLAVKLSLTAGVTIGFQILISVVEYVQLTVFDSHTYGLFSTDGFTYLFWLTVAHILCILVYDKILTRPRWFKARPYLIRS